MKSGRLALSAALFVALTAQAAPTDDQARFRSATQLAESGKTNEAITLLESLNRANPRPETLNNLAVLYARRGDLEKARETLMAVFDTDPAYATAFANLREIHARLAGIAYARALDTPPPQEPPRLTLLDRFSAPATGTTVASASAPVAAAPPKPAPASRPIAASPPNGLDDAQRRIEGEILGTVTAWSQAWSSQDVDGYLSHYADDFSPTGGLSRDAWAAQRRERLKAPGFIKVEIANPQVRIIDDRRAEMVFEQAYRADHYQDRVLKRLTLKKIGTLWRIEREVTLKRL